MRKRLETRDSFLSCATHIVLYLDATDCMTKGGSGTEGRWEREEGGGGGGNCLPNG